jgi:hypothetical protein
MSVNIKYKDSVFSVLFNDPDILRELYCALTGLGLPDDVPVTINTLQDVLYMDRVNDISFEIGGKLVILLEHQSTINPNMAIRLFIYISRVYEKIIGDRNIYSGKKLKIPRPEFFVLYNGKKDFPDMEVIRLSDSFEETASLGLTEAPPSLDITVKVIKYQRRA